MIRLSVNVNKVATLRNSRGGRVPCVLEAVQVCIDAGAPGITVHPRADRRHITPEDVRDDCARTGAQPARRRVQHRRRSAAGSARSRRRGAARSVHARAGRARRNHQPGGLAARARRPSGCRTIDRAICTRAAFASACSSTRRPMPIRWAASVGRRSRRALHRAVRPRVRAGADEAAPRRSRRTREAAELAHALGLGVNAGHDLDLDNLVALPRPAAPRRSVDRPRAHVARAVRRARTVVREYLDVLADGLTASSCCI